MNRDITDLKEKNVFFLGPLFREEEENMVLQMVKREISLAPNIFQWNIIKGLNGNLMKPMMIINAKPIGVWPKQYRKLILKNEIWEYDSAPCYEIGGINIPVVKQATRYNAAKKWLNDHANEGDYALIYSVYVPFLKAALNSNKRLNVISIITDLPEYYDLAKVSFIKKIARRINNRISYKLLKRANKYVILTEHMGKRLGITSDRYTVVEGICSNEMISGEVVNDNNCDKIVFLYSGSLILKYGIQDLIEAFCRIQNEDIELWICGSGEAETYIKQHSLEDKRIKYYGFLPTNEVAKLRSSATFLINPRKPEGEYTKYSFPSKTMEYMLSGKPVLMFRLDGVPDEYYKYVIDMSVYSKDSIYNALQYAINLGSNERKKIGSQAREFVLMNKNPYTQTKKIIELMTRQCRQE